MLAVKLACVSVVPPAVVFVFVFVFVFVVVVVVVVSIQESGMALLWLMFYIGSAATQWRVLSDHAGHHILPVFAISHDSNKSSWLL